jgi:hypothetical protein
MSSSSVYLWHFQLRTFFCILVRAVVQDLQHGDYLDRVTFIKLSHSFTHSHSLTLSLSLSHSHTLSHKHTHSFSLSHLKAQHIRTILLFFILNKSFLCMICWRPFAKICSHWLWSGVDIPIKTKQWKRRLYATHRNSKRKMLSLFWFHSANKWTICY